MRFQTPLSYNNNRTCPEWDSLCQVFSCVKFDGWVLWLGESKSDEHGYLQYKGYCSPFDPRHFLCSDPFFH